MPDFPIDLRALQVDTRYRILDADGHVVRSGTGILREGAMGTIEIVYDKLSGLPIGVYTIEPGGISIEVRPAP